MNPNSRVSPDRMMDFTPVSEVNHIPSSTSERQEVLIAQQGTLGSDIPVSNTSVEPTVSHETFESAVSNSSQTPEQMIPSLGTKEIVKEENNSVFLQETNARTEDASKNVLPAASLSLKDASQLSQTVVDFPSTQEGAGHTENPSILSPVVPPVGEKADETTDQVQNQPLPVNTPVEEPPQPTPVDKEAKILEIRHLASQARDPNVTTQACLSNIVKELSKLFDEKEIRIEADLERSGTQYEAEPFTISTDPKETFYKVKIKYIIKAGGETFELSPRTLFTEMKTPEEASHAALKYKDIVIDLALSSALKSHQSHLENFPAEEDKRKEIMNRGSFRLNFACDAAGKPFSLLSINYENKDKIKVEWKVVADPKKYDYVYHIESGKLEKVEKEKNTRMRPGQTFIYPTEEEAIWNMGCTIKDDNAYERLETDSQAMTKHVDKIKEEIKQKEKEFSEFKKQFVKEPLIKWFGAEAKTTKELDAFINNLPAIALEEGQTLSPELTGKLSTAMVAYVNATKDLKAFLSLQGDQQQSDIDKLKHWKAHPTSLTEAAVVTQLREMETLYRIADPADHLDELITHKEQAMAHRKVLETRVQEAQNKITSEQEPFNRGFVHLQRLNYDLTRLHSQLNMLKSKANEKKADLNLSGESKISADSVLKTISDREMASLEAKTNVNKNFIKNIMNRLAPIGADRSTPMTTSRVWED